MSQQINVGKVSLILRGLWDSTQPYEYYDCVKTANGSNFAAKKDVPAGTPLTNTEYWYQLLDGSAIDDAVAASGVAQIAKTDAEAAAQTATDKAIQASSSAATAIEQANGASTNKDATDDNVESAIEQAAIATEMAVLAATERGAAEAAANRAEAAMSNFCRSYYRTTVEQMNAITDMRQGDICYVTNFETSLTTMYTYDINDVDGNGTDIEWICRGTMRFADLSRDTLLAILQLSTVALTGSYNDLLNKPNRYESFTVVTPADGAVTWDYGITDKVKITLTADTALTISNIYNGAVGIMEVYGDFALTLPTGSDTAADYDYIELLDNQHWQYMFMYDGTAFHWTRTVCG